MTRVLAAMTLVIAATTSAFAQECLHGPDASAEQKARKRDALTATRMVNNLQANRGEVPPLSHEQLLTSRYAQGRGGQTEAFKKLNFTPGAEILPGWELTLNTTQDGYWFMIKDKTDPCGFAYISNQTGLIYNAEPIR